MIVKTPRGEAPEHIRKAWLLLKLPCIGISVCANGVLSGKSVDHGVMGYKVPQEAALEALFETAPEAVQWWNENGYPTYGGMFVFYEDEVVVLSDPQNATAWG